MLSRFLQQPKKANARLNQTVHFGGLILKRNVFGAVKVDCAAWLLIGLSNAL